MTILLLICLIIDAINCTATRTKFEWELVNDFPSTTYTSNFMCGYDDSNDTIWILMNKLNTSPDEVFSLNPTSRHFTSYNTYSAVTSGNCQFYTATSNTIYSVRTGTFYVFDMIHQSETVDTAPFTVPNSGYCIAIHSSNEYLFGIVPGLAITDFIIYGLNTKVLLNGPPLNYSAPGVDIACTVSTYNNYLYVFGGTSIHKIYVGDEASFIPLVIEQDWITLDATLSNWVECNQMVQINDQIFIIGGKISFTEYKSVDILNVSTDVVSITTSLNIARARGCAVYASKSDSIFVFGGANYGYTQGQPNYEIGKYVEITETTVSGSDLSPASSSSSNSLIIIFVVVGLIILLSAVIYFILARKKKANMKRQLDSKWQQARVVHEPAIVHDNKMEKDDDLPPYTPEMEKDDNDLPPPYTPDDGMDNQNLIVSAPPEDNKQIDMREWLTNSVELPQYIDTFVENGFDDLACIIHITKDELKQMNVLLGHQVKIMTAVNELKQNGINNNQQEKHQNEGADTVQFQ